MAITIQAAPTVQIAAWRPLIHEVSSNRYLNDAFTITGVTSGTGTYARFACASHTLKVGDVVTGTAFTGGAVAYNQKQTVTVVSGAYFETNVLYVAGSTGTITRSNENFKIKCETYGFTGSAQTYSGITQNGGEIRITYASAHELTTNDYIYLPDTSLYAGWYKVNTIVSTTVLEVTAVWTSTETGYTKTAELIGTKRQEAIYVGANIRFRLDVSGHLQSILTTEFFTDYQAIPQATQNPKAIQHYGVLFTEEFDNEDGLLTTYDTKMSASLPAIRAVWQHTETQSMSAYYAGNSSSLFLTKAPSIKYIRPGEEEQLSILVPSGFGTTKFAFQHFDLNGTPATVQYSTAVTPYENRITIPVNSNIFSSSSVYFQVWLVNSANTQKSEKRTFIVDKKNYQNPKRFHFENSLGGIDAYTFTGDYSEMQNTEKTGFKKQIGLSHAITERGHSVLGTFEQDEHSITSEYLNKANATWLKELSGSAWVVLRDGELADQTVQKYIPVFVASAKQQVYTPLQPPQLKIVYKLSNSHLNLSN